MLVLLINSYESQHRRWGGRIFQAATIVAAWKIRPYQEGGPQRSSSGTPYLRS